MNEVKVKWPLIAKEWDKTYFNYIDLGNYTMFRMSLYKTCQPRPGLYVSIEDRGSFFFSLENNLHKDYVGDKLFLDGDKGQMADFLNAQLNKDTDQQGTYYEQVIKDVEPYGKIGEGKYMPWSPEIL